MIGGWLIVVGRGILLAAFLWGAAGVVFAEEMPDWLKREPSQEVGVPSPRTEPSSSPDATADERAAEESVASPQERIETRSGRAYQRSGGEEWRSGGPYLEDFILQPDRPVETMADRARAEGGDMPVPAQPEVVDEAQSRYHVQPSDVLNVTVWREPDLAREITVSPDGWITYPLVGEVLVEGLTLDEIRSEIEAQLARYINNAAVNVSLMQSLGNRIYVLGKVNNPGVFPFAKSLDVVQALSLAGGVARFAEEDDIRIIRRDGDEQHSYRFRYNQVRRGRNLEQNILLQSGDVVMVP